MHKDNMVRAVAASLLMTGCSTIDVQNPATLGDLPSIPDTEDSYFIQVGDKVRFFFPAEEQLVEELVVRPDGKVHLALLDSEVQVAGRTTLEVAEYLRGAYGEFLKSPEPELTVNILEFAARQVYVGGEVTAPQAIPYRGKSMSVLDAVTTAGYFTDRGNIEEVILLRYMGSERDPTVVVLNLRDAIENIDVAQNVPLMPEDIIIVPLTGIAEVNKWVDQYIRKNIPLPIGFVY